MNYQKTIFKNNFRLISIPMKDTQTVTVMIGVGVGSRYEEEKEAGLSHFIEHMLFKGTKKRPNTLAIAETIDAVGGEFNAFTGKTSTVYYAKVDAQHWKIALDVISDMYLNSQFKRSEIEREKGTILQELNMYEDIPMRNIEDIWEKLLYGKYKLGREIIGYKKTIRKFKRKDFINYFKRFYIPNDTVLVVAGNVSSQLILSQTKKYFTNLSSQKKPVIEKIKEKQTKPQIKIRFKKTDQTHFILGARAYNLFHPDRYVLNLLATILGGGMSSRLFIQVRERKGLAYYVKASVDAYQDVGYLAISAGVEHKNLQQAIKIIIQELNKIKKRKITEKELAKAKNYIKGKMIMKLESSDEIASFVMNQELLMNKIEKPQEIFQKIEAVTTEDIKRVAQDVFTSNKMNLAIIGPHKSASENKIKKELFL